MATNPTQQAYDNWQAAKTPWYRQQTPTSAAKEREAEGAYTQTLRNPQGGVSFGGNPGAGLAGAASQPNPATPKPANSLITAAGIGAGRGSINPPNANPAAPPPSAPASPLVEASRQQDWSRQGMSNAQVGQANPQGRVQVEQQTNGTTSFSGGNVSGPVSYTNRAGAPVAGAGFDGQGFGDFDVAPAGASVGIGSGSYAFGSGAASLNPLASAAMAQQSPQGDKPKESWGDFTNRMIAMERGQPAAGTTRGGSVQQLRAPTVAHSGNDFAARKRLENMATSASSITNSSRWGGRRANQNPSVMSYMLAQQADLAAQGKQPDMEMQAMGLNAGLEREGMQQAGADRRDQRRGLVDTMRLGMEQEAQAPKNRTRSLISSLQEQIAGEKDGARRSSLVQQMRDVEGKNAEVDPYLVVPGGQQTNREGQVYTAPSSVFNRRSGTYLQQPGVQAATPAMGAVMGGYRFKGGDPADQTSWEAV